MKRLLIASLIVLSAQSYGADYVLYANGHTNAFSSLLSAGSGNAFVLPSETPANDMYMVWPTNANGYGSAMYINKTEYWWAVPNELDAGETLYVHGQNLELGDDGLTQLYIDGHGWVDNDTANPYMASFTMPSLADGDHTAYIHNGHGKDFGWSDAFTITIASALDWTAGTTYDITASPYNADNTGSSDCIGIIEDALGDMADGDTLYFPAGTYRIDEYVDLRYGGRSSNKRWLGDGPDSSIIYYPTDFVDYQDRGLQLIPIDYQFEDLQFKADYDASKIQMLFALDGENLTVKNCKFDGLDMHNDNEMLIFEADGLYVADCTFEGTRGPALQGDGAIIKDNVFIVNDGGTRASGMNSAKRFHIAGNTFHPYDTSDEFSEDGWAQGRCIVFDGGGDQIYIGGNTTTDMAPRWSNYLNRYGGITLGDETATASTTGPNTVTVPAVMNGFALTANGEYVYGTNTYFLQVGDSFQVTDGAGDSGETYFITDVNLSTGVISTDTDWHATAGAPGNGSTLEFNSNEPSQGSNLNSGEQFLWEHQRTYFRGSPSTATSDTVTISDTDGYSGQIITIISGKGYGQSRHIDSDASGVLSVSPDWDVVPNAISVVTIGNYAYRVVIYDNDQDGFYNITAPYDYDGVYQGGVVTNVNPSQSFASVPFSFYGGASSCVVDGNRVKDLYGFGAVWAVFDNEDTGANGLACPNYFNHIRGNSYTNSRVGINFDLGQFSGDLGDTFTEDILSVGNMFSGNTTDNVRGAAAFYAGTSSSAMDDVEILDTTMYINNTAQNGTNNTLEIGVDEGLDGAILEINNSWN